MYFFCFIAFIIFLVPAFLRPRYRVLRGVVFVTCGVCSAIPIMHIEYFTEQKYVRDFLSFPWALGGGLYIFGACMFMMRIPERFKPGFFDIVVSFLPSQCVGLFPLVLPLLHRDSSLHPLSRLRGDFSRETTLHLPSRCPRHHLLMT